MFRRILKLLRLGCVLFFAALAAAGYAADEPPSPERPVATADPLGRDTPFGTVVGFTKAVNAGDLERAANFLEGTQSEQRKQELAQLLDTVLNRGVTMRLDKLSRQPDGHLDDGLPPDLEQVATARLDDDEELRIVLRRVPREGAKPIWLYSSETLKRVPAVAGLLEPRLTERIWPDSFGRTRVFSLPLFVWANTLLALPLALALAWLISRALNIGMRAAFRHRAGGVRPPTIARISPPIFLLTFALLSYGLAPLGAALATRVFWTTTSSVLAIAGLAWLLTRTTHLVFALKIDRLRQAGQPSGIAMIELFKWTLAAFWVLGGLFLIMRSLGFEVSTAVAGLGVGGIAIAFAAQKTIADLFGTITVIGDEAVRVGDACRIGTLEGRVESIGLRSTRIRSLDRTLVTIPNGQLATMNIENLELRDKFLCDQKVRLARDTTSAQLRQVLDGIRTMALAHPKVDPTTVRVRLTGFGESSLDIQLRVHVRVRSKSDFLEVQEDLLLRTADIVEASGARLSLPARVTYPAANPTAPRLQQEHSS